MFAQLRAGGWSLQEMFVLLIVLVAVSAVVYVVVRAMGVTIPQWVSNILLIILLAVVGVVVVRFLFSL